LQQWNGLKKEDTISKLDLEINDRFRQVIGRLQDQTDGADPATEFRARGSVTNPDQSTVCVREADSGRGKCGEAILTGPLQNPPNDRGMIYRQSMLGHHLFQCCDS
jgi:hypothetical protein